MVGKSIHVRLNLGHGGRNAHRYSRGGGNVEAIKEEYIAPLVGYLSSDANDETTGGIFQVAGGWIAQIRWQRTGGHGFPVNKPLQPEDIIAKWKVLTDFGESL